MTLQPPLRPFAILRHLLVLFAVVGLLATQSANAGMSMEGEVIGVEMMMDAHAHNDSFAQMQSMDHCAGDACASMICYYAMPIAMSDAAMRHVAVCIDNTLLEDADPAGIIPVTLPKPPKHA